MLSISGARIVNTVRKIRAKTKKANEEKKSRKLGF